MVAIAMVAKIEPQIFAATARAPADPTESGLDEALDVRWPQPWEGAALGAEPEPEAAEEVGEVNDGADHFDQL